MASQTRRRLWRSTLVATLVGMAGLVALAVSAAWASIPDSTGTIHACYRNDGGALRVIDTAKGQTCRTGRETALDWNQAPPAPPAELPGSFVVTRPGETEITDQNVNIADILLEPGHYQVTAKLQLGNRGGTSRRVGCSLTPSNADGSPGNVGSQPGEDSAGLHIAPAGQPGEGGELTFFVSQTLDEAGVVILRCGADAPTPTNVFATSIALRATEVGSITTTEFPPPLP